MPLLVKPPFVKYVLLTLLLACALVSRADDDWPQEPPRVEVDAQTLARLMHGEVLVENDQLDASGGAARVQAVFMSSAPDLWDKLGDCEANYQFVEGLKDCELLESDEHHALTRQSVKKSFLFPRLDFVFETARKPNQWVAIRLVSGDLKVMEGSWRFEPLADSGMLVTHNIRVVPKMPAPRWLIRRSLRKDIGDMVACLRALAGASIDDQGLEEDSGRCP